LVALYLRYKYPKAHVYIDYPIDSARWYGVNWGEADVVLIQGNQAWIWEVKHVGPAEAAGIPQLAEYLRAMKVDHPNWSVHKGMNIPQLVGPDPLDRNQELVAESTNTRSLAGKQVRPQQADGIVGCGRAIIAILSVSRGASPSILQARASLVALWWVPMEKK
jgi:hypothetical protein